MTPGDAARVLAKAAAFDQRTVGDADIAAWAEALDDIDLGDALAAVTRHYSTSTDRLMPVHVIRIAADLVRARRRAERESREAAAAVAAIEASANTRDRSADVEALIAQVRVNLPDTGREAIRPREVAWERERRNRERAAKPEPNPLYDPSALERLRDMAPDGDQ